MNYFLAKTDPDTYSIEDFANEGTTLWDGVHSNPAILQIQKMKPGDRVYIYESLSTKAIVGIAEVVDEPFLNSADPRRSWAVHLKFLNKLKPVTLAEMKTIPELKQFDLIRQSRLSVMTVSDDVQKWLENRTSSN